MPERSSQKTEKDQFREENLHDLAAFRDQRVPQPEPGEPFLTIDCDTGRITFRDQDALDEYVREAKEADRD